MTAPPMERPATSPTRSWCRPDASALIQLRMRHPCTVRRPEAFRRTKSPPARSRWRRPRRNRFPDVAVMADGDETDGGSDRRQAATTLAAAVGDVGPPSLGGHAGTEPMLADAANLLRLVLTFHGEQIRGSSGAANLINHEVRVNHHVRIRRMPTLSPRPCRGCS